MLNLIYNIMKARVMIRTQVFWLVLMTVMFGAAHAQTVTVRGTDNPFLANQPRGTACCGGDTAPAESPVLALRNLTAGEMLTFSATGGVGYTSGDLGPSADGEPNYPISMTADYGTGVSGPLNVFVDGLVGVFTTGTAPSGPAPSQLNSGVAFKILKPGLAQIFWIGDGQTGTGTGSRQKFVVPTGATSLYLGVVDGGGWYDNVGTIKVKIHVQPAPNAWPSGSE